MASIHRRKNRPGWTVSWYEGGRKRRAQRATRRLAENLSLQIQLQKDNPDILRPDQLFRTYAEDWLSDKAQHLQEGTTRVYDQALQKHILPAFGSLMLRSIERRHARAS